MRFRGSAALVLPGVAALTMLVAASVAAGPPGGVEAGTGRGAPAGSQRPVRSPDVYFAPTRQIVADAMLRLAGVTAADTVVDLGSGDGRILVIAAQKYGARGIGIEIDPRLVEMSRLVAREAGVADRVTFVEGDLLVEDVSAATVVTLYLSPGLNRQLEPKLRRELRPGARIVSHQFDIGRWRPDETVEVDGATLHLWRVPDR